MFACRDQNVVELMQQASKNASQLVTSYQNEIIKVAKALLKRESLATSKITELLGPKRVRGDLSSVANFLKKQV
jgi:ATP-dependent Zn protease